MVDPPWKDTRGYTQFMKARVMSRFWPTVGRNQVCFVKICAAWNCTGTFGVWWCAKIKTRWCLCCAVDHFLCTLLALLPGTCWMRVASFLWRWLKFLEGKIWFCLNVWNVNVHVLEYGASNGVMQCVKNRLMPWKNVCVCFWVWYNKWFDTMCEESFVAVKKYLRQQGVRSSLGSAMLSSLFCLELLTPFRAWVDATCDVSFLLSC